MPDTAKASFAHDIACEVGEEPLHQVQPGTRRGRKMHVKTRVSLHPGADVGVLVCAVVVRDHVDFQVLGGLPIDLLEKAQPLHMGMFRLGTADDLPSR